MCMYFFYFVVHILRTFKMYNLIILSIYCCQFFFKKTLFFSIVLMSGSVLASVYSYDSSGRVIGIVYPDGKEIGYEYDASGNISVVDTIAKVDESSTPTPTLPATPTVTPDTPSDSGGGGCFIATAAYGSYFEPEVLALRVFRDNYLLTNNAGRYFVSQYYRYSPPMADYIRDSESLKSLVRVVLTPLVYFIKKPHHLILVLFSCMLIVFWRRKKIA